MYHGSGSLQSLLEIKVAFSTHSVDSQAFHKWPEPIPLNPNFPINIYDLSSTYYGSESKIKHIIPSSHDKIMRQILLPHFSDEETEVQSDFLYFAQGTQ